MTTKATLSPRERLLRAADKLFYEEGINAVGIDRVIEKAGVAKASLYSAFGSKDELVRAYLDRRQERRQERIHAVLAEHRTPRAKLVAMFDYHAESLSHPAYRGCAFTRANLEQFDNKSVRAVCEGSRAWLHTLFRDLAREAGMAAPLTETLVPQLVLLYDGASVSAYMDASPHAGRVARDMAVKLWDDSLT